VQGRGENAKGRTGHKGVAKLRENTHRARRGLVVHGVESSWSYTPHEGYAWGNCLSFVVERRGDETAKRQALARALEEKKGEVEKTVDLRFPVLLGKTGGTVRDTREEGVRRAGKWGDWFRKSLGGGGEVKI